MAVMGTLAATSVASNPNGKDAPAPRPGVHSATVDTPAAQPSGQPSPVMAKNVKAAPKANTTHTRAASKPSNSATHTTRRSVQRPETGPARPTGAAVNAARPNTGAEQANANPAMDPGVMNGLQKWADAARPGEAHKALEFFAGTWNAQVQFSNLPGGSLTNGAGVVSGKVVTTWVHGGRFLRSEYTGGVGGKDFTASATLGYNNATGVFEGTWMDSTSTGQRSRTGSVDSSGNVYTFTSEFPDAITGAPTKFKEVLTVFSDRHYIHQVFEVGPTGIEHRVQEVAYTRLK